MTLDRFKPHKAPEDSAFFDKVLPIVFIALGVITVALMVFAIGVITGFVQWN